MIHVASDGLILEKPSMSILFRHVSSDLGSRPGWGALKALRALGLDAVEPYSRELALLLPRSSAGSDMKWWVQHGDEHYATMPPYEFAWESQEIHNDSHHIVHGNHGNVTLNCASNSCHCYSTADFYGSKSHLKAKGGWIQLGNPKRW